MVIVVMGVSGSGKTTIGQALSTRLHAQFFDGDDFHSDAAKAKMHAGHALTDEDRAPWLARLHVAIETWLGHGVAAVLACSALKRSYRDVLGGSGVRFVYLRVDEATLEARMLARQHFMPESLLASQLATLEEPTADEALIVDGSGTIDATVGLIVAAL